MPERRARKISTLRSIWYIFLITLIADAPWWLLYDHILEGGCLWVYPNSIPYVSLSLFFLIAPLFIFEVLAYHYGKADKKMRLKIFSCLTLEFILVFFIIAVWLVGIFTYGVYNCFIPG